MMRMLMIVALLASLVLLSTEKHQAKVGPQRVEVLRMLVISRVVTRADRMVGFRKAVPRGRAGNSPKTAPRKASQPKVICRRATRRQSGRCP